MVLDGIITALLYGKTMIMPAEIIQFQEDVSFVTSINHKTLLKSRGKGKYSGKAAMCSHREKSKGFFTRSGVSLFFVLESAVFAINTLSCSL